LLGALFRIFEPTGPFEPFAFPDEQLRNVPQKAFSVFIIRKHCFPAITTIERVIDAPGY